MEVVLVGRTGGVGKQEGGAVHCDTSSPRSQPLKLQPRMAPRAKVGAPSLLGKIVGMGGERGRRKQKRNPEMPEFHIHFSRTALLKMSQQVTGQPVCPLND